MQHEVLILDVSHAEMAIHADHLRAFPSEELHHLSVCELAAVLCCLRMSELVRIDRLAENPLAEPSDAPIHGIVSVGLACGIEEERSIWFVSQRMIVDMLTQISHAGIDSTPPSSTLPMQPHNRSVLIELDITDR